ncbi:uncharacterized protein LOC126366130 [Pectinophora gossypiella]|uniref:uncharacterized protein LOC126366130 n=1 Tax=Pectinophora gossypiella TaxID=13191 RepID=UPI00214E28D1|nr:uncharacterized protein LOC126366130 [Pectinophora gossypiella]XP_049865033.1 uncharacterized protein LOC126366130 [Pectinophora gossypiella]
MLNSLSDNTYKQYDCCIRAWVRYCNIHNYDYDNSSVHIIIAFLTEVFESGAQYGTINSYKSALCLLLGHNLLNNNDVCRFMKGVFRLRPTKPKYDLTWDPAVVLNYLALQWPNEDLSLENLSKKTLTLLALVTAHRVQTFSLIKISNIDLSNLHQIIIKIPDLIKTSKPNSFQPVLKLPYYNDRPEICPARCIKEYINKTSCLRSNNNDNLFISYRRPHSKISAQRLSHWVRDCLKNSGVDTSVFSAHSTRHASTSAAGKLGVSIETIKKTAGWSQSSLVFARFYNRNINVNNDDFARAVLSSI